MGKNKKIGEILVEKGLLTPAQLAICLEEQARTKEILGKIFLRHAFISEQALLEALSVQHAMPCYSFKGARVDWELLKIFSSSLVMDYRCVPVKKDAFSLTVAITNPLDIRAIQKSEEEARGLSVKFVLVTETDMDSLIREFRRRQQQQINNSF